MRIFVILLSSALFSFHSFAANIERGEQLSETCVACHERDGNSVNPLWPKIAGQHEAYLLEQMQLIRKGPESSRVGPLMYPFVQNLSDQDLADLAAYFAAQKTASGEAKGKVSLGQEIYRYGLKEKNIPACAACHSPSGHGNKPALFPAIASQHPEYLVDQLKKYASGVRNSGPNRIMQDIATKMSEEEMLAVANYMHGLQP